MMICFSILHRPAYFTAASAFILDRGILHHGSHDGGLTLLRLVPAAQTQQRNYSLAARTRTKFYYQFPVLRGYRPSTGRKKLVILGTGWGSMHFLKYLDCTRLDVTFISPRSIFVFTPLLPSVAVGTLSALAAQEPVRNFTRSANTLHAVYYEAAANAVDFEKQKISCVTEAGDEFNVDYDYLVMGIGSDTNTFGIPGVDKYAVLLKEVEHAVRIRKMVINNFERASLPSTSDDEKSQLLHFVAVGGGPTGVETIAELADLIYEDMTKYFPDLIRFVRLTLIEMNSNILPMFSTRVAQYTLRTLLRHQKVNVLLQHAVTRVRHKSVEIESRQPGKPNKIQNLAYGILLWAVGVTPTALGRKLIDQIPEQQGGVMLKTNQQLRLLGTENVYAIGDCKEITPPKLKDQVDYFIQMNGGQVPSSEWFRKRSSVLAKTFPQISKRKYNFWKQPLREKMTRDQLLEYLESIDSNYKTPLATAQNARQEGLYLACLFNDFGTNDADRQHHGAAFLEVYWGALAYVGRGRAVATLPGGIDVLGGWYSFPLWKMLYLAMQLSPRSKFVVSFDWFKIWACGRDVGRDHIYIPGELIHIRSTASSSSEEADREDSEVVLSPPLTKALSPKLLDDQT